MIHVVVRPLDLDLHGSRGSEVDISARGSIPAVRDIPADEVALWSAVVEQVAAPAARARLSDLLFLRREGRVGDHARRAITAYLDAIENRPDDMDTTTYILRAWTLVRQIQAQDLEPRVLDRVQGRVDALVAGDGRAMPGVLLPLLAAMTEKPLDRSRQAAMHSHADRVLQQLAGLESRDHIASSIASLRRRLLGAAASDTQQRAISADELAGYLRGAEASPNALVRLARLDAAAKLATQRGLTLEAREISAQLQAIRPEELGLQTVSETSSLPIWIPEAYLTQFTRGPDWRHGVLAFLCLPDPPSGNVARLQTHAIEGRGTLSRLFATTILGPDGLPRATLTSEEDKDRHQMAFLGRITGEHHGDLLAEGLHRIKEKFGTPNLDELTSLLVQAGTADPRLARSLAKGLIYFWAGDTEASVHLVIPKIEAAARALLRELDEGIYRVQVTQSPGGYPGLYSLLDELEKIALDEDWAWYLRWLLLGPIGANLRNEVAHGFVSELSPGYAALVLRAAAVLITASPVVTDLDRCVRLRPELVQLTGHQRLLDRLLQHVSAAALAVHGVVTSARAGLRAQRLARASGEE